MKENYIANLPSHSAEIFSNNATFSHGYNAISAQVFIRCDRRAYTSAKCQRRITIYDQIRSQMQHRLICSASQSKRISCAMKMQALHKWSSYLSMNRLVLKGELRRWTKKQRTKGRRTWRGRAGGRPVWRRNHCRRVGGHRRPRHNRRPRQKRRRPTASSFSSFDGEILLWMQRTAIRSQLKNTGEKR